eukprot:gene27292-35859_t
MNIVQITVFVSTLLNIFLPVFATLRSDRNKNETQLASTAVVIEKAYVLKAIIASGVLSPTMKPVKAPKALESNIDTQYMGVKPRTIPLTLRPSASKTAVPTSAMPIPRPTSLPIDMYYHNNKSVMTGQVSLYNIYVGEFNSLSDPSAVLINYFSNNVDSSSWYDMLSKHYYQYQNGVKTYITKNGLNLKKAVAVDPNALYTIIFRGRLPNFSDPAGSSNS